MSNRISAYDNLPAGIAVLTKYTNYIETPRLQYLNQQSTSDYTGVNPTSQANLFMTWAGSADQLVTVTDIQGTFDPKRIIHTLPQNRWVLSGDGTPYVFEYDNYTVTLNRTSYYVRYDALFGPSAQILQDWIRLTIFNDSFVAPFVAGTVS